MKTISLVKDFTDLPGARYRWQGDYSGEAFREEVLEPALREHACVEVNLDGAVGLPSSFLDESFGVLAEHVKSGKLKIVLTDNAQATFNLENALKVAR